ncbi:glutamate--tRNA ligase [Deinococcus radiodurans R1 = ATCC 13939 = DSM 20539]|nr:glutamyl-tRNA synthetase [Deinococcus radiodurans R1 = ATCC 13939 = DSM 20539]QEM72434.1 glutamate--tRNA ligase [Deinococcus radiodurans]UDK99667.1 glutamate--tRNA ligase [Deinococcus radiodurans R1 = ATCC 13939 = DSM 20539]HCE64609.1 glutamate--tRNA ligase [Deinococcus radiodurans]
MKTDRRGLTVGRGLEQRQSGTLFSNHPRASPLTPLSGLMLSLMSAPSSPRVTRIAPSPTGDPHVGTAYIGLFNHTLARQSGGRFILRVEDTDRNRYVPDSEKRIFQMMQWLNLTPDESPLQGGPNGPYRQSERFDLYGDYARQLVQSGHAYYAFETSDELAALREEAQKAGHVIAIPSRDLGAAQAQARVDAGEPAVIRLKVDRDGETVVNDLLRDPIHFANKEIDDKVLLKADGFPTYHLANVVDDRLMQVTHVVRAEEWITSTPIHVLLYRAFGWPEPVFAHMPLLRNADKSKISKRKNPTSVEWYQNQGFLPEAMLNFLATMGWTHPDGQEIFDLAEFERVFRLEDVTLGGPVFDLAKLRWYNGKYLREVLSEDDVARRLHAFLMQNKVTLPSVDGPQDPYFRAVTHLMIPRLEVFADFMDKTLYFWSEDYPVNEKAQKAIDAGKELLPELAARLKNLPTFDAASIKEMFHAYAEEKGLKMGKVMPPIRAAVAGTMESPDLPEMLEALGRERVLARVEKAAR